ncbi:MAG: TerC family protein [Myxococcota bacterium]
MDTIRLFPFGEVAWFYGAFTLLVIALLALDLGVFHRKAHEVRYKEALGMTALWTAVAGLFGVGLWWFARISFASDPRLTAIPGFDAEAAANSVALEYVTGWVIEKALAVDNLFVFAMVFAYFGIPTRYQHRVLFYGIAGALVFRAVFIALGATLLQFHWVVVLAGLFLVFTGLKMAFGPEKPIDPDSTWIVRAVRRVIPITPGLEGDRLFVRKAGRWFGTPLLVALVCIEASDIVFAIDSVPAIFAVTDEPLIVFTSNVFAILGLRSLYFVLTDLLARFHLLKYSLAAVLVFVGAKMVYLNEAFGGKFPIAASLGIVVGLLVVGAAASAVWPKPASEVQPE